MKNILTGILLLAGITLVAQPSLKHTFTVSTSICNLEKSGDKYFSMDVATRQCRIYNMDYTLYKTISLTVPADYYLYNVQYVSENTFNTDDLIELVYIYSKYNLTETSYYYNYETKIINENGVDVIPTIIGAGHTEIIETESNGRKFMAYVYDFFQIPATTQTQVYSLPDPNTEPLKAGPIRMQYRLGTPWPNPSGGLMNIPVKLPPGEESGELILYNIHGQEVMRQAINGEEEVVLLQGGNLIPGTYVFKLKSKNGETQGKKITIY